MDHQQYMADVALEINPETGFLAYDRVVLIGPRQSTGKSEFVFSMMTHRCVGFTFAGPQVVLYTAQTADEARKKWRRVHMPRLLASATFKRRFTPLLSLNHEVFEWRNGSTWFPGSTTGKTAGTGDTLDLGVVDEAWSRPDARTELGMAPAMDTRPWSQFMAASMIPGLTRSAPGTWPYLKNLRDVGIARTLAGVRTGTAFFFWAAPDGADPADPATWWSCMPGLGVTVRLEKIQARFDQLPLADFCAEYLGWEPLDQAPKWQVIQPDTWKALYDPLSRIGSQRAMSIEMDEERTRAYIGMAGPRGDGHWHGEVVEPGLQVALDTVGVEWVLRRALKLWEDWKPVTVVIDPSRPAASLIVPLRNNGVDVYTPNKPEIAAACGRWFDRTGERRVLRSRDGELAEAEQVDLGVRMFHLGQRSLDRALASARPVDAGSGGFTFVRRGSSADICPLYLMVLAMLGVEVKGPEAVPEPWIFYDGQGPDDDY